MKDIKKNKDQERQKDVQKEDELFNHLKQYARPKVVIKQQT